MQLARSAVRYYTEVTGNPWSKFYDDLDVALSSPVEEQMGEIWLIHMLMNTLIGHGVSVAEFKANKDVVKAEFDETGRKKNGEFFTPVRWAEELHRYMDRHIPDWRKGYYVWEPSCYAMRHAPYIYRSGMSKEEKDCLFEICTSHGYVENQDFIFQETPGYTFFGACPVEYLEPKDQIVTYDVATGQMDWCGFHNLFVKQYTGIMYTFELDNGTNLSVTADHSMVVRLEGEKGYQFIEAGELVGIDSTYYILMRNGETECKVWGHYTENGTHYVWDLTTDNFTHCFAVSLGGGSFVFSSNCGSGNLIRTADIDPQHLFASTLQHDDVTLIQNTESLQGCTAFQLDFLSAVDGSFTSEFLEKLPASLQDVILNDKPLVILANPPYKSGAANLTEVGKYMQQTKGMPDYNFTDFSKPAYDLFYQCCFQTMNLVARFNLSNTYYCFFGPLTFFTGSGANILFKQFERCFEFVDGMCISAQEFSDTSDSILWGISGSIWKARGGYIDRDDLHKDVLLDKKFITPEGEIGCEGKVLYEPPRQKLSDWVAPKYSTVGRVDAPLMTSHLTFKGSQVFEKVAPKSGLISPGALGTLMVGNTLTRSADQSAILSMPTTIQYVDITEENFWRCVGSYAFRRTIDAGWAIAKKEISAPNPDVEGYDLWLRNALVSFLFEYKSMMSSLRNVQWGGYTDYCIVNRLFYLTEDEIRQYCHDEVILKDLEEHPLENQFMLQMISESEPYWVPEIKQLFDWCKAYTLSTYDLRKTVNYKGSLECADAGFQQLRSGLWDANRLDNDMTKLLVQARSWLKRDIWKFGFVSEVISEDM